MIERLHALIAPLTARVSLALRVAILTTAAVAATLTVVSALIFITVRSELQSSLDDSMLRRANTAVASGITQDLINGYPSSLLKLADVKATVLSGRLVFSNQSSKTVA
ncbi:MAG: hypothetical protein ABIR57_15120, partial [Aeromicrobium sp.]